MESGSSSPAHAPHHLSVSQVLDLIKSDDPDFRITAAQEIRRLTKTSHRFRRHLSAAVPHLVSMLRRDSRHSEPALLALLNLAVKDEKNKISIVEADALDPIIKFLGCSENTTLQENATAALLTLSASSHNKPLITSSGAIPLLLQVLEHGTPQAKVDAVMALYNLSTHSPTTTLPLILGVPGGHPGEHRVRHHITDRRGGPGREGEEDAGGDGAGEHGAELETLAAEGARQHRSMSLARVTTL